MDLTTIDGPALLRALQAFGLPLVLAITLHEAAHAFVARLFGDPTASLQGRLTLNPLKHIDPIGTVLVPGLLLAFGGLLFGWAKPVPVATHNLRPRRLGMALVALAGPASNVLMAGLWLLLARAALPGSSLVPMASFGVQINVLLAVLNCLPIPPLDGSRVITSLLPHAWSNWVHRLEPMGLMVVVALASTGMLESLMQPGMRWLYSWLGSW